MDLFVLAKNTTAHAQYVEVPWDLATGGRTDLDPVKAAPMPLHFLDDGTIARDATTLRPLLETAQGDLVAAQCDVWLQKGVFLTPFGPCCLTEADRRALYADRSDILVCGGRCCRQPVQCKVDQQYRILKHYDGIEQHMMPATRTLAREAGPFAGERIQQMPDRSCCFWRPHDGKCAIHAYADAAGLDWRALKPTPCVLFPFQVTTTTAVVEKSPYFFVECFDPGALHQHGIQCPIGDERLKPAYLNMKRELDFVFGPGFWEVMSDVWERSYRPLWDPR